MWQSSSRVYRIKLQETVPHHAPIPDVGNPVFASKAGIQESEASSIDWYMRTLVPYFGHQFQVSRLTRQILDGPHLKTALYTTPATKKNATAAVRDDFFSSCSYQLHNHRYWEAS